MITGDGYMDDRSNRSPFADCSSFACEKDVPTIWPGFDQHHDIEANLILEGGIYYLYCGERVYLRKNMLAVFWAARPHQIVDNDPHTEFYYVHVPFSWFLGWNLPDDFRRSLFEGGMRCLDAASMRDRLASEFAQWSRDYQRGSIADREGMRLEVEAWLLRTAARLREAPIHPDSESSSHQLPNVSEKLVRIVEHLAAHYLEPVRLPDVAAAVGLNANYAATLFRTHNGITIGEFVLRLRVAHAQLLLATTDLPVLDVAYESGFGSACNFHRAFKGLVGRSPGRYRAAARIRL